MDELETLTNDVAKTLARAVSRTGVQPYTRVPARANAPRPATAERDDHAGRVRVAARRQRAICNELQVEIKRLRAERHTIDEQVKRLAHRRETLLARAELAAHGLTLERDRCRRIDSRTDLLRATLARLLAGQREVVHCVLETQEAMERISAKLRDNS